MKRGVLITTAVALIVALGFFSASQTQEAPKEADMTLSTDLEALARFVAITPAPIGARWVVEEQSASSDWSLHAVVQFTDPEAALGPLPALSQEMPAIPEDLGVTAPAEATLRDASAWGLSPLAEGTAVAVGSDEVYIVLHTR